MLDFGHLAPRLSILIGSLFHIRRCGWRVG
jgi:hypothetical protein